MTIEKAEDKMVMPLTDPKLPSGKITVNVNVDSDAVCKARNLLPFHYKVSRWANHVVGFDTELAIYGLDNLSKDVTDPSKLKSWGKTLVSGNYTVAGEEPILYLCAFSPSEGGPIPILKKWHMCGCCYQFNADNATNFINDCQDSEGTCQDYCKVTSSGPATDRVYQVTLAQP